MPATDQEIAKTLELLGRDFASTRAARHVDSLPGSVEEVREWYESLEDADIASLTQRVVDDTQDLMDTFLDTTWPACPRLPNHPLWFRDGAWYCERDGVALATLGDCARSCRLCHGCRKRRRSFGEDQRLGDLSRR
jgi:hypothetical protein